MASTRGKYRRMYSSLSDIQKLASRRSLAQLTDDDAGAVVNEDRVSEAILASDEVIDAHLRGRYELPFDETPPFLRRISADIAIFHLFGRRPEREMPETISMKYKNAVKMLEAIRDGKLTLGEEDGEKTPEPGMYKTNKSAGRRMFK